MIINNAQDLNAAPSDVRDKFIAQLAAGVNRWEWQNGEWVLVKDAVMAERFGFGADGLPGATVPEKPNYNPDQNELDQQTKEARTQRDALLSQSDWTQVPDAPVDQAAWAQYRQALRDVPQQSGFPGDITWPVKP
jgi:hypothetical protein